MTIDEMQLAPNARRAAELVLAAHPAAIFTSGRRDVRAQARAMAENTMRYGTEWLAQTYRNQEMVKALVLWTHTHPEDSGSSNRLTEGFYRTLVDDQSGKLMQFPHLRGDAFDIQCPRYADGRINEQYVLDIKRTIERLPVELGLQLILTREGQHRVIHAQFAHAVEAVDI